MDETRRLAMSYAEQQVDATQGVSNKIQQSKFKRNDNGDTMTELAKSIVMPFNNFASNTKSRMIEDIYQIKNGNSTQKKYASVDLASTIGETVAFQAANAFIIAGVERYGIRVGLGKLFGLDPEKDNVYEYTAKQFQKFYTGIAREIIFSGFGGEAEQVGMDGLNRLAYQLSEKSKKESGEDYYTWLKKEPLFTPQYTPPTDNGVLKWSTNMGAYGIAVRNAYQVEEEARAAYKGVGEGEYEFTKQGKASPITKRKGTVTFDTPTDKYLNMNERAFSTFMALGHGLSAIGLSEQDIIRAGESKERDVFRAPKTARR